MSADVRRLEALVRRHATFWAKAPEDFSIQWDLAKLLQQLSDALVAHGELARAMDVQKQTVALWRQLQSQSAAPTEVGAMVADALVSAGLLAGKLGEIDSGRRLLDEAVALRERQVAAAPPGSVAHLELGRALCQLAALEACAGATSGAKAHLNRALGPLQQRAQHAPAELAAQLELVFALERIADLALGQRYLVEQEIWRVFPPVLDAQQLAEASTFYASANELARVAAARFSGAAMARSDLLVPLLKSSALHFVSGEPEAGLARLLAGRARIDLAVTSRHTAGGAGLIARLMGFVERMIERAFFAQAIDIARWLVELTETVLRVFDRDPEACRRHAACHGQLGAALLGAARRTLEAGHPAGEGFETARHHTELAMTLYDEHPDAHPTWTHRRALFALQLAEIARAIDDRATHARASREALGRLEQLSTPSQERLFDLREALFACAAADPQEHRHQGAGPQIERVALLQRCMAVESRLLDLVPGNPRVIASAAASAAALAAARLQQGQFDEGQALLGRARAHRDELASTGWTGDTVDLDRQLRLLQLAYAEQRARTATEARVNPPARRLLAGTQNGKKPDPDA